MKERTANLARTAANAPVEQGPICVSITPTLEAHFKRCDVLQNLRRDNSQRSWEKGAFRHYVSVALAEDVLQTLVGMLSAPALPRGMPWSIRSLHDSLKQQLEHQLRRASEQQPGGACGWVTTGQRYSGPANLEVGQVVAFSLFDGVKVRVCSPFDLHLVRTPGGTIAGHEPGVQLAYRPGYLVELIDSAGKAIGAGFFTEARHLILPNGRRSHMQLVKGAA